MGSVFLAQDTILRRDVALKLPLTGTENDPEVRERFLREARSAATLDHPYICRVYDADVVDGRLYMAMAYIEGKSLADLVRAEGIPPRQVVALVGKLAIAMNEAHLKGVVHRDLKPRNVMIRTVGTKREPVIVDFGLARLESVEDVRMTRTGQVMGTPAYMAPEQLRGNPAETGPACDIYALGVILYELLTGQLPFSGSYAVMVAQILTQTPNPPSSQRPGLDTVLDAICLKALTKDASSRYTSMKELATVMAEYLRATPSVTASSSKLAPITRPLETDSIPTGADTLVSQMLGNSGKRELDSLGIVLDPPEAAISTGPPRVPTSVPESPTSYTSEGSKSRGLSWLVQVASGLLALIALFGLIVFMNNRGSQPKPTGPERAVVKADPTPPTKSPTEPSKAGAPLDSTTVEKKSQLGPPAVTPPAPFDLTKFDVYREGTLYGDRSDPRTGRWYTDGDELVMQFGVYDTVNPPRATVMFGDTKWTDYDFTYKTKKIIDAKRVGDSDLRVAFITILRSLTPQDQYEYTAWSVGYYPHKFTAISLGNEEGEDLGIDKAKTIKFMEEIWYSVRAEVRGDRIKMFVSNNDGPETLMCDVKDGRYPKGRVGLKTIWGIQRFKDIKVTAPDGQVLWEGLPAIPPLGPKNDQSPKQGANLAAAKNQESGKDPTPSEPTKPKLAVEPFSATIGMKFASIPAGEFLMGSTPDEYAREHPLEFPKHPVRLTKPYLMATTEVTQGQYQAIVGTNPSRFKKGDDYPVENVSWLSAVKFCNGLSLKDGLPPFFVIKDQDVTVPSPLGTGYRLPTEAEWEFACRARGTQNFSFGNDDAALPKFAWVAASGPKPYTTHPVGGLQPNAFGLYDMHGNVQEWCWDTYAPYAPYSPEPVPDPTGPRFTTGQKRAYRNGAYDDSPFYNRSSYRAAGDPVNGSSEIGFRVVRSLPKADANQAPAKKKISK